MPSIAETIENIDKVYEHEKTFLISIALFWQSSKNISLTLPPTYLSVIRIEQVITCVSSKLK